MSYDNDLKQRNTNLLLLPMDEGKPTLSEKDRDMIRKAVTILLLCRSMEQKTKGSLHYCRSVLGEHQSHLTEDYVDR